MSCYLIRFVEGRVDGAREAEPVGYRGKRSQHGEGIGASHHVEVVDLAALFTQPEPFGQEHEVELAAFGGPREPNERVELDVAAGFGITPDRGVVDPWKMRGQMNLLDGLAHARVLSISDGRVAVGRAG